jgi:hypothetical protein
VLFKIYICLSIKIFMNMVRTSIKLSLNYAIIVLMK